jgi:hypothetical protein
LMWTSTWSEVESIWWKSTSSLGVKNIPAHYHFYKDTVYSESFGPTEANYYVNYDYYITFPSGNMTFTVSSTEIIFNILVIVFYLRFVYIISVCVVLAHRLSKSSIHRPALHFLLILGCWRSI